MDTTPTPHTDWQSRYLEVEERLLDKETELEEFTKESKEYEAELEAELKRFELEKADLWNKKERLELENEQLRNRIQTQTQESSLQLSTLQSDKERLQQELDQIKNKTRDLELTNDDLERSQRVEQSSLTDLESKYNRLLEKQAMLEHELELRRTMDEDMQRLKDELRDAKNEIAVLEKKAARAPSAAASQEVEMHGEDSNRMQEDDRVAIKKDAQTFTPAASRSSSPLSPSSASAMIVNMVERVQSLELRLTNCRKLVAPLLVVDDREKEGI